MMRSSSSLIGPNVIAFLCANIFDRRIGTSNEYTQCMDHFLRKVYVLHTR